MSKQSKEDCGVEPQEHPGFERASWVDPPYTQEPFLHSVSAVIGYPPLPHLTLRVDVSMGVAKPDKSSAMCSGVLK